MGNKSEFPATALVEHSFLRYNSRGILKSHCNSRGTLSPLLQFERYPDFPATTQMEPRVPCCDLIGSPIFLLQLERNPEFSVAILVDHSSLLQLKRNPEFPT